MSASNARRNDYTSIPIPTYEEATSITASSQRFRGPTEISNDAERQGFLDGNAGSYRRPTVESIRNSLDSQASDLSVPDMVHDETLDRRQLEELDYMEPGADEAGRGRRYHRARIRNKISQQLSNLSATLGSLRLPSLRRLYAPVAAETEEDPNTRRRRGWRSRLIESIHIPEQYRMSIPTFARLCALLSIAALVWLLFALDLFPRHGRMAIMFDTEEIKTVAQELIDSLRISEHLRHLSSFAHEAGSEGNYFMAQWMKDTWEEIGELDDIRLMSYSVLANYPVTQDRSVKITSPVDQQWTAMLEEDSQDGMRQQTLSWHAHSANGQAEGPLIYANAGSRADFQYLRDQNITTNGTIALVHMSAHHDPQSIGLKARFAHDAGCVGLLVFNADSIDQDAQQQWPNGALPRNDSLHRANVALPNWVLGDPLTPGRPSSSGARKDHEAAALALPQIPSLPLSWRDASVLLTRISDHHGQQNPKDWLPPKVHASTNSTSNSTIVQISNHNDVVEAQPIYNLHALISGMEPLELKVYVGAPRDSWCFGASESASASAILTELINIFGEMRRRGWRPLRNVEFVSWDAKTFNSAGSTEFVEDSTDVLRGTAVAYINVEHGISGQDFDATGSPLLQRSLQHVMQRVGLPGSDKTLKDVFDTEGSSKITPLQHCAASSGSMAFSQIAGLPTMDLRFSGEQGRWVQGSCYNTAQWMDSFGDPGESGFHSALATVWTLVILDLVSSPLLPLDVRTFAAAFADQAAAFEKDVTNFVGAITSGKSPEELGVHFQPLDDAVESLRQDAASFHEFEEEWTLHVTAFGGMEDLYMNRRRNLFNHQLAQFEKSLIDTQQHKDDGRRGGLKDRPQFRHVLYAPEKWSDGIQTFAMVWDYLEEQEWEKAGHELKRIASIVQEAGRALDL